MCAGFTKATGKQWVQPIGFKHALLEVAIDALKRTKAIDDPKSIVDAIAATNYQSIVGPVSWAKGPVKNCTTTPLVGGQWARGKTFKYDIEIANNAAYPAIKTVRKFTPIAYGSRSGRASRNAAAPMPPRERATNERRRMAVLLALRNVSKSFGAITIARDLDLIVEQGEAIGVLGPNGAG
jgi:hypothetical protein